MACFVDHFIDSDCSPLCQYKTCKYLATMTKEAAKAKGKQFLHPTEHADKIEALRSYIGGVVAKRNQYVHGFRTTNVESAHYARCQFTDKKYNYWGSFGGRCYMSVLWGYFGPGAILMVLDRLCCGASAPQRAIIERWQQSVLKRRRRDMNTEVRKRRGVNKARRRATRATYVVASAAARGAKENTYKSAAEKAEREFRGPAAPTKKAAPAKKATPKEKANPKEKFQCTKCTKMLQKGSMREHHKRLHPTAPAPAAAPPAGTPPAPPASSPSSLPAPTAKDFLALLQDDAFRAELEALVAVA